MKNSNPNDRMFYSNSEYNLLFEIVLKYKVVALMSHFYGFSKLRKYDDSKGCF